MKLLAILCLLSSSLALAQDVTPSKLNDMLIAQRDQLNAVHLAQLATVSAHFKAKLEAAEKRAVAAEAALAAANEKLAEAAPFIEAAKSEKTKKREALATEIAAKQAELARLKP